MSLYFKNGKLLVNSLGKIIDCSQCPCNLNVEDEDVHYSLMVKLYKLASKFSALYSFINVWMKDDFTWAVRNSLPFNTLNSLADPRPEGITIPHSHYAPERWEEYKISFLVIKNNNISNIKRWNSDDTGRFQFQVFGDITTGYLGSVYLSASPLNAAKTVYSYDTVQWNTQDFQTHLETYKLKDEYREEEIYNFYYLTGAGDINTFINTVKQLANRNDDNVVLDNKYFLVDNGDGTYTIKHADDADIIKPKSQVNEDIIPGYIRFNDEDYGIEKSGNDYYITLSVEKNLGLNMVSSVTFNGTTYYIRYGQIVDSSDHKYDVQKDLTTGKYFVYINNVQYYLPSYLLSGAAVTIGTNLMQVHLPNDGTSRGFFYISGNPTNYIDNSSWTYIYYDDLNKYFFSVIDSGNSNFLSAVNQLKYFYFYQGYYILNNTLSTFTDSNNITRTVIRRDNGDLYFEAVDSNNNNITGRVFIISDLLDTDNIFHTNYIITGNNICVPAYIYSNGSNSQLQLSAYASLSVVYEYFDSANDVIRSNRRFITTKTGKEYLIFAFEDKHRLILVQPDETKERPLSIQFLGLTYNIKLHGMSYVNWHLYYDLSKWVYEPIYYDSTAQKYYITSSAVAPSAYITIDLPANITLRYYSTENSSLQDINTLLNEESTYYVNDGLPYVISAKIEKDGLWGYNYIKNYTYTGTITTNANKKYFNFIDGNQYLINVNGTTSSFVYNNDEIKLYLDGSAFKCDIFRYVIYDYNNSINHFDGGSIGYFDVTNQITSRITNGTYSYTENSYNLQANMSQITGGATESYFKAYVNDEVRNVYYNRITQEYYYLDDDVVLFVDDREYEVIFSCNKWYMDFKHKRVPLLSSVVSNKTVWSVVMASYPDMFNIPDLYEPNESQSILHNATFRVPDLNRVGLLNVGLSYSFDYKDFYYLNTFPFYFQQSEDKVLSSHLTINGYDRNIYFGYLSSTLVADAYLVSKDDEDRYYVIDNNNHVIFLPITLLNRGTTTINDVEYTITADINPNFTYIDELTNQPSSVDIQYDGYQYYYKIRNFNKKVTTNGTDSNGNPIFNNIEFNDTLGTAYSTPYYEDGILLDLFIEQYKSEISILWKKLNWRYETINPLFSSYINVYCFKQNVLLNQNFNTLFHTKSNFEPQTYTGNTQHTGIYVGDDSFAPYTQNYDNDIVDERSGFKAEHAGDTMKYYTVTFGKQLNKARFALNEQGASNEEKAANQELINEMQNLQGVTCLVFYLITLISCDENYNYTVDYVTSAFFTGNNARNFDFGKEYDIISHAVVGTNGTATTANTYDILNAYNHGNDMTNIQYGDITQPLDYYNMVSRFGRASVHITYLVNPIKTY